VRYSIVTLRTVETFTVHGGRIIWDGLAASCEACGCEIHSGRRTAETDGELRARLHGKRTRPKGGILVCANCGRAYKVTEEPGDDER
jgi:uncharacterized protein YbaR (Trm112 family)